jgi:hypothetical protein
MKLITPRPRPLHRLASASLAALVIVPVAACAPTIHVQIDPITINAKLDADVRVRLDREVQQEIQQNPNLF